MRIDETEYFVELLDRNSERRVAVGNFVAASAHVAIDKAARAYPGFFRSLETRTWYPVATPRRTQQASPSDDPEPIPPIDSFAGASNYLPDPAPVSAPYEGGGGTFGAGGSSGGWDSGGSGGDSGGGGGDGGSG